VSSRSVQGNAWCNGGIPAEAGVFVHSPPKDSAVGKAGLQHGDTIVTADGQDIDAFGTLQAVVREHASGETINLQVRRAGGQIEDVAVLRN
jgi:S1-C subfamily serine protease